MNILLCRNRVADFSAWKAVFDAHAPAHREAGLSLAGLWRDIDDPHVVCFVFEVANLERARAFIADPAGGEAGRQAGVIEGDFRFLASDVEETSPADSESTQSCAWCGAAVAGDQAIVLRVGARLCEACADRAGRIAAEQGRTIA
jgi:hypothetical protein